MTSQTAILIVEDEPKWSQTYKRLLSRQLSNENLLIEETNNLTEARKLLRDRRFDVVLLDLRLKAYDMSDFRGKELLPDLVKITEQKGTQVIVVSAHLTPEIVREAFKFYNAFDIFDKRNLAPSEEEFITSVKEASEKAQTLRSQLSNSGSS